MISSKSFTKLRYYSYGLIFILAVFFRFSGEIITLLDPDAAGYVEPALSFINTGHFTHVNSRSYPYPLLVLGILVIFKTINAIALVQHLISLISYFCLLVFLEKKIKFTFCTKYSFFIFLLILFFTSTCYLNGNLIFLEKSLRPEGLQIVSSILTFYFILRISESIKNSSFSSKLYFLSLTFFLMMAIFHPRMSLAYYTIIMISFTYFSLQKRLFFSTRLIRLLVYSLLVFFALNLPEEYLIRKHDKESKEFAYKQFFFSNLPTVMLAIQNKDFVNEAFDEIEMKEIIQQTFAHKVNKEWFSSLGYNIDYGQYNLFKHTPSNDYFKKWFYILIRKYPLQISKKSIKQLYHLTFSVQKLFIKSLYFNTSKQGYTPDNELGQLLVKKYHYNPKNPLIYYYPNTYLNFLIYVFLYILKVLFFLTMPFYIFMIYKNKSFLDLTVLTLFLVTVITIAITHTFDNERYIISLAPFFLASLCLFLFRLIAQFFFKKNLPPNVPTTSVGISL